MLKKSQDTDDMFFLTKYGINKKVFTCAADNHYLRCYEHQREAYLAYQAKNYLKAQNHCRFQQTSAGKKVKTH